MNRNDSVIFAFPGRFETSLAHIAARADRLTRPEKKQLIDTMMTTYKYSELYRYLVKTLFGTLDKQHARVDFKALKNVAFYTAWANKTHDKNAAIKMQAFKDFVMGPEYTVFRVNTLQH